MKPAFWDYFKEKLQESADASHEGYSTNEILEIINNNGAQWHTNGKCVMITQIDNKPVGDICLFWLTAGPLIELQRYEPTVIKWAKDIGCVFALIAARKGWLRASLSSEWKDIGTLAQRIL